METATAQAERTEKLIDKLREQIAGICERHQRACERECRPLSAQIAILMQTAPTPPIVRNRDSIAAFKSEYEGRW